MEIHSTAASWSSQMRMFYNTLEVFFGTINQYSVCEKPTVQNDFKNPRETIRAPQSVRFYEHSKAENFNVSRNPSNAD